MSNGKKQYWKGLEQLSNDPEYVKYADREFPEYLPINNNRTSAMRDTPPSTRRDFLKMMGFSVAAASMAACEAPVRKAIPYLNKPETIDPGVANHYATTYNQGGDFCSIVVKTREGRPIKIEGNKLSELTQGGVSAQVEASILSLYDQQRLKGPYAAGAATDWETLDNEVKQKLASSRNLRIISGTVSSPTLGKVGDQLFGKYPQAEVYSYDARSSYGIAQAYQSSFGETMIPFYDFSKAKVIVSLDADFLGTWISPIVYARQYAQGRKLAGGNPGMSRHYQFESVMSMTGSNADYRIPVKPSQQGFIALALYDLLAGKSGAARVNATSLEIPFLEKAAEDLWTSRGESLVVSGSNDLNIQIAVNAINQLLGNYGNTIDNSKPVNYRKGNDQEMSDLIQQLSNGEVDAVIFYNCNPLYDHPQGAELAASLENVPLKVSTSGRMDETAVLCDYVAPSHHYLESWGDVEPVDGQVSLIQPTITPLFNTRQAESSMLTWLEAEETDYYEFLRENWRNEFFPGSGAPDFDTFWHQTLYDGVYRPGSSTSSDYSDKELVVVAAQPTDSVANGAQLNSPPAPAGGTGSFSVNMSEVASAIKNHYQADNAELELVLYQKVGIGTGDQANNPWLQEMPDPVTKAVWDNYLTMPQSMARELKITMKEGHTSRVDLTVGDVTLNLPVLIQPGQARGTLGLALGYGRTHAGPVADNLGVNAYPLVSMVQGIPHYHVTSGVKVEKAGGSHRIAQTQTHETYMGRETIIQEALLSEYQKDAHAGEFAPKIATWKGDEGKVAPHTISLWKHHQDKYVNHHWGMAIDLNSCTGCSACTIACQAENNIPVVGREEVLTRREMHWLRIDRYYSSVGVGDYEDLEVAAENPEVTFQPMMCQHCNNAPCETVCPVAATTHSTEGLNQMAYNRCIGTRYCANNCPYKVRRFNWFKYHDNSNFPENLSMSNSLGRMVLNPDVTVRSRGVMEKCTMCVQRIQAGKLVAKQEGRRPTDKDIDTACAVACPTKAITFGDLNNPESQVSKLLKVEHHEDHKTVVEPRAYTVLQELNVDPNIFYLRKIRNKESENA